MKRYKVRLVDNEFRGLEAIDQTGVQAGMTRVALGDGHLYLAHEADAEIAKLKAGLVAALQFLDNPQFGQWPYMESSDVYADKRIALNAVREAIK